MLAKDLDFSSVRVLDGGLATELERRGCNLDGPLWSAQVLDRSPETVAAVHLDYLRAGADCIATASYQVSARGYEELGREGKEAERALHLSVEIAEEARARYAGESSRRVWIAGSLGPYGAALHNGAEYHGNYEIGFEELVAFHEERVAILAETGVDLLGFETIPSLEEAQAIVRALESSPTAQAWISFTCRDRQHVAHGESLRACAAMVAAAPQVVAVGINCTAPGLIAPLVEEAQAGLESRKPVIVYPNSGEQWDPLTRRWRGASDVVNYGSLAGAWFAAGAQAVGGCCRTGPDHIRAVASAARGRSESLRS